MDQSSEKRVRHRLRRLGDGGIRTANVCRSSTALTAAVLGLLLTIPGLGSAQYLFTTIDVPKATRTAANGNSTHEIVGEFDDQNGNTHGFILNKGVFTTVDFPKATNPPLVTGTSLNGINASGQYMGTYFVDSMTSPNHAFVWEKGHFTTLDPAGATRSQGGFINAKGEAVGTYRDSTQKRHGFVWRKGGFTTFNVPNDHPEFGTVAMGINDIGEVVGNYVDTSGDNFKRHGFLRSSKGTFTSFDFPDRTFTSPTGINNSGQIVGFYADEDFFFHGFVVNKGVFTTVDFPDASETQIFSINAKGEIVGTYFDADGDQHGFVGTPVR